MIVTEYFGSIPGKRLLVPNTNLYQAAWNESDVYIGKYPLEQTNNPYIVSDFLAGRRGNYFWFAHQKQLDLYVRTNESAAYDPENDNNQVTYYANYAGTIIRKYLNGGFDFLNMNWTGGHLSAEVDSAHIDANLDFNSTPPRLTGNMSDGNVSAQFRCEFHEFGNIEDKLYPRKYDVYIKMPNASGYELNYSANISDLKIPYSRQDYSVFYPSSHIDTNNFGSFLYVSNVQYFIATNQGLIPVRAAVNSKIPGPLAKFIQLIVVFSIAFIPLAIWVRQKLKKQQKNI